MEEINDLLYEYDYANSEFSKELLKLIEEYGKEQFEAGYKKHQRIMVKVLERD